MKLRFWPFFFFLVAFVGCGEYPEPPDPIQSFTAQRDKVTKGQPDTITAVFSGSGEIDNGIGGIESDTPIEIPAVNASTTYTLTVVDENGETFTRKLQIDAFDAPVITSFKADKVIRPNQEGSLTAVFVGHGRIDAVGDVESGVSKSVGVVPQTHVYNLTVSNDAGDFVEASAELEAAVMPTITQFDAPSPVVSRFAPTMLTAVFKDGKGTIDQGVGEVKSGMPVATPKVPSAGASYTLTVTNGLGESATKTFGVTTKKELFVNDYGADVLVFDIDAKGDVPPKRVIETDPSVTGILGVVVYKDEVYIACEGGTPGIAVYDVAAEGKVQPKRRIAGPLTTIDGGYQFSVADGEIFLADKTSTVKVWNATDTGNVAPKRVLAGAATKLNNVLGTFVANGELFAASYAMEGADAKVTVYPEAAKGNVAPTRSITIGTPIGLFVAGTELFVSSKLGTVTVFNKATGAQLRKLEGPKTTLTELYSCVVADAELVCGGFGTDQVVVFPANATGDVPPTRTIGGAETYISGPSGVFVY